ncbi:MAG: class I SAM-dependent methyltransferase [bacterium]|nr:class I SAM-dependent methyltransferase [bacterium]
MNCPVCLKNSYKTVCRGATDVWFKDSPKFDYIQCLSCGLVSQHPQISKKDLPLHYGDFYEPYTKGSALKRAIKMLVFWKEKNAVLKTVRPGSRILEIGCGRGEFLKSLSRAGFKCFGLEMGEEAASSARKETLNIFTGSVDSFKFTKMGGFDLIIMRFVLEHLWNPAETLLKLRKLLFPGGKIMISVPNFDSFERRFFGKFWSGYDAPRHLFVFDPKVMRILADKCGLSLVSLSYSIVPNDWISGLKRWVTGSSFSFLSSFFTIYNPFLMAIFTPLCFLQKTVGKSSRIRCVLALWDASSEVVKFCDLCKKEREVRRLWSAPDKFTDKGEFSLVACKTCGLAFVLNPPSENMENFYLEDYPSFVPSKGFHKTIKNCLLRREVKLFRNLGLKTGSKILEVGSGSGEDLSFLKTVGGFDARGLDFSKNAVNSAKKNFGLDMHHGSLLKETYEKESFDAVRMKYVVSHVPSPKELFSAAGAVLKSGGILLLWAPNFNSWSRKIFGSFWEGGEMPRHLYSFSEDNIKKYLAESGFSIVSVKHSIAPNTTIHSLQRVMSFYGFRNLYKNFALSWFSLALFLPVSSLAAVFRQSDRIIVIARKI